MNFYNRIAEGVSALNPSVTVLRNQIPKAYVDFDLYYNLIPNESDKSSHFDQLPRVGAFEVSYKGKLIFSKLLSWMWPNIDKVANKCAGMIDAIENGSDPSEYFADPIKRSQKKSATGNANQARRLRTTADEGPRNSTTNNRFVTSNEQGRNTTNTNKHSPAKSTKRMPNTKNGPKQEPVKDTKNSVQKTDDNDTIHEEVKKDLGIQNESKPKIAEKFEAPVKQEIPVPKAHSPKADSPKVNATKAPSQKAHAMKAPSPKVDSPKHSKDKLELIDGKSIEEKKKSHKHIENHKDHNDDHIDHDDHIDDVVGWTKIAGQESDPLYHQPEYEGDFEMNEEIEIDEKVEF